jgi:hypothetical protein
MFDKVAPLMNSTLCPTHPFSPTATFKIMLATFTFTATTHPFSPK